jgi:hypothetical protein
MILIRNDKEWPWPEKGQTCTLHIVSVWLTLLPSSCNFLPRVEKIQTGHLNSYISVNESINSRVVANFDLMKSELCSAHRLNIIYISAFFLSIQKIQSGHKIWYLYKMINCDFDLRKVEPALYKSSH